MSKAEASKKATAKVGDVFIFPVSSATVGIGRVARVLPHLLYVVMYLGEWGKDDIPPANKVSELPIALAAITQDAKIWHGHWKIIGNETDGIEEIQTPLFRSYRSKNGTYWIESYDGTTLRPASEDEARFLPNRFSVSPARLEKALRAKLGYADWKDEYEKLDYDAVAKAAMTKT